jgi:hypothetical protein
MCFQAFSFFITAIFQADATQCHDKFGGVDELSPRFFDSMKVNHNVRRYHYLVIFLISVPSGIPNRCHPPSFLSKSTLRSPDLAPLPLSTRQC